MARDLLHDRVREALADPDRRLTSWKLLRSQKGHTASPAQLKRLGEKLVAAKTLALSADMTEWLAEVSCWHPETMERALRMARLPWSPLWIEIDEHARQRGFLKGDTGGGSWPDTVRTTGFLLENTSQEEGENPVYSITQFSSVEPVKGGDVAMIQPVGYYLSPEPGGGRLSVTEGDRWINKAAERGCPKRLDRAYPDRDVYTDEPSPFAFACIMWGHGWVRKHTPVNPVGHNSLTWHAALQKANGLKDLDRLSDCIMRLSQQAAYYCAPMWAGYFKMLATKDDTRLKSKEEQDAFVQQVFQNSSGDLHFLATLLALINTNAKHLEFNDVPGVGSRTVMARNLPYYGYSKVTLRIPALQVERRFRRTVNRQPTLHTAGWHPVRGHWMYFSRTGNTDDTRRPKHCLHSDHHTWRTDEEDGDRHDCVVCGYRRTWRVYPDGWGDSSRRFINQSVELERNEGVKPEEAIP